MVKGSHRGNPGNWALVFIRFSDEGADPGIHRIAPAALETGESAVCSATIPDSAELGPNGELVGAVKICWLAVAPGGKRWGLMEGGSERVVPSSIFPHGGCTLHGKAAKGYAKLTSSGQMSVGAAHIFTWLKRCQTAINEGGKGGIVQAYADYAAKT